MTDEEGLGGLRKEVLEKNNKMELILFLILKKEESSRLYNNNIMLISVMVRWENTEKQDTLYSLGSLKGLYT